MKKPFSVGDKVRVYGHIGKENEPHVGYVSEMKQCGDSEWEELGYVLVRNRLNDVKSNGFYCHPKQCRKLIKKQRATFYIDIAPMCETDARGYFRRAYVKPPNSTFSEFIEVKRRPIKERAE